jgi:hypothetical protein
MEKTINQVSETSATIIRSLDALEGVHPVVGRKLLFSHGGTAAEILKRLSWLSSLLPHSMPAEAFLIGS